MIDKSFIDKAVVRIIESSDILMEFFKPKSKLQDTTKDIRTSEEIGKDAKEGEEPGDQN
jgi:hypothetical protein